MASGAISLSLSLVADVFGRRRGRIVLGDPTYFLAAGIFKSAGLEVTRVPVDEGGFSVAALADLLAGGLEIDLVYCIPTHHNPTGTTMAADRRLRLVELAHEHDFVVVADEPYNLLEFEGPPRPPLASHESAGSRVISVGSFTKILAPGLRCGWIHAAPDLLDRVLRHGVLQSGGALNPVIAAIVEQVVESGELDRHVTHLRATYAARFDALDRAIAHHLPGARVNRPQGGYFAWLRLPDAVDAAKLATSAKAHDLALCPGTRCGVGSGLDRYLRLCAAFYESGELEQAVARLALACAEAHS
jgi:DNA-binding transcriptional MocR family regulator